MLPVKIRYIALAAFSVLTGCSAPRPTLEPSDIIGQPRWYGRSATILHGKVGEPIKTFLQRLYDRTEFTPRHLSSWTDTSRREDFRERLLTFVFQNGRTLNPQVLDLGEYNGARLAGAFFKPDGLLKDWLTEQYHDTKGKYWPLRNGIVLLELRSAQKPHVAGLIRFKNISMGYRLRDRSGMVPLDEIERMHGLHDIVRRFAVFP